jgi:phosphoadenosine phosphosulfate reductase
MAQITAENLEKGENKTDFSQIFDSVFWCTACEIPLLAPECPICLSKVRRCARDLKPVFAKERTLFESLAGTTLPTFLFANKNHVYFNGKTLFSFTTDPREGPRIVLNKLQRLHNYESHIYQEHYAQQQWKLCLEANQQILEKIEREALDFIQAEANRFSDRRRVVAFSGGKDSAVTALLVQQALGTVPLLFGDTTIEFPETYEYAQRFAIANGFDLFVEKPDADFLELCDELDPPSRVMRWCCTVCKSRPINKFYNRFATKILSFDGIRRMESSRRAEYPRVVHVQKFSRQVSARPIVSWSSFTVWLYIFQHHVDYNPLYEYGYSRVGCMYCPSNTPYNDYLTKTNFPELYDGWTQYLLDYASKTGKQDPEGYVLDGFWKSRKIGKDRTYVVDRIKPCEQTDEVVYSFASPIQKELIEFLKPFGSVSVIDLPDSSCFVVGSHNPFVITGSIGDTQLSVSFTASHHHLTKLRIEKQIEKYLNCVQCGGCLGVCPTGAISIRNGSYHIDDGLCTRCGRCTTTKYLKEGCVTLNFSAKKRAIRRE